MGGRKRPAGVAWENADQEASGPAAAPPDKRPRRQSSRRLTASEMELWTDSDVVKGAAKTSKTAGWKMPRKNYDQTKIGPDHQVDALPAKPPMEGRLVGGRLVPIDPVTINSKLVYSCAKGGKPLDTFLALVRAEVEGRDGFPLSPWNEERALLSWMEKDCHAEDAKRLALMRIPRGLAYPGSSKPLSRDEAMTFAAFIGQEFDHLEVMFRQMSKSVLKTHSIRDLIVHWYTGYMPMGRNVPGSRTGYMVDLGVEARPPVAMRPNLAIECLHVLAATAGDGFPPERRMRDAILEARANLRRRRTKVRRY